MAKPLSDALALAPHPSEPIPVLSPSVVAPPSTDRIGARRRIAETPLHVFPVGLSTPWFGSLLDTAESVAVLDRYVERGGNFITTSDDFSGGRADEILGRWMLARGLRDHLVVSSRIGLVGGLGTGPRAIVRAVDETLTRLRTDHLDLVSLVESNIPLDEMLAAVDVLVAAGKVRHVAAVDFGPERLFEARILVSHAFPSISAIEVRFNLLERTHVEGDLELLAKAQGLSILPSSALAHGFLAGSVRTKRDARTAPRGILAAAHLHRRGLRTVGALDTIAAELGCSVAAVALAWTLSRASVTAPIVSLGSVAHVDAVVEAARIRLTRSHLALLERRSSL